MKKIIRDPNMFSGRPYISGTNLTVSYILKQLASGLTIKDIRRQYPQLTIEEIVQVLKYAAEVVDKQPL